MIGIKTFLLLFLCAGRVGCFGSFGNGFISSTFSALSWLKVWLENFNVFDEWTNI